MKIKIISDSSCDLENTYLKTEYKDISVDFEVVPFVVTVDGNDYIDDGSKSTEILMDDLKNSGASSSSCPSPYSFEKACTGDMNFIITISSKMSGSYNSAVAGTSDFSDKVFIIDSKGTGGSEQLVIDKLYQLINEKKSIDEIKKEIIEYRDSIELYFTLSCFDNLVKKGRIRKELARIIQTLKISLLCRANNGEIALYKKCLSINQTIGHIMLAAKEKLRKDRKCVITYVDDISKAIKVKEKLTKQNIFTKIEIKKAKILNSFYALRNGIIVAY